MNKIAILPVLITCILSSSAYAEKSTTLHFTGTVIDSGCKIAINSIAGDEDGSLAVSLGSITLASLKGGASVSVHNELELTDCPATMSSVKLKLDGTVAGGKYFANSAGGVDAAENTAVMITDDDSNIIIPNVEGKEYALDDSTKSAIIGFDTAMIQTDAGDPSKTTIGKVVTDAQIDLVYL